MGGATSACESKDEFNFVDLYQDSLFKIFLMNCASNILQAVRCIFFKEGCNNIWILFGDPHVWRTNEWHY
jgi:hypothetical protein